MPRQMRPRVEVEHMALRRQQSRGILFAFFILSSVVDATPAVPSSAEDRSTLDGVVLWSLALLAVEALVVGGASTPSPCSAAATCVGAFFSSAFSVDGRPW